MISVEVLHARRQDRRAGGQLPANRRPADMAAPPRGTRAAARWRHLVPLGGPLGVGVAGVKGDACLGGGIEPFLADGQELRVAGCRGGEGSGHGGLVDVPPVRPRASSEPHKRSAGAARRAGAPQPELARNLRDGFTLGRHTQHSAHQPRLNAHPVPRPTLSPQRTWLGSSPLTYAARSFTQAAMVPAAGGKEQAGGALAECQACIEKRNCAPASAIWASDQQRTLPATAPPHPARNRGRRVH